MVHRRGMKILAYSSTGFLQWTDPDFRQEWSPAGLALFARLLGHGALLAGESRLEGLPAAAADANPGRYGVDGLYIDGGYVTNAVKAKLPDASPLKAAAKDEMAAFDESPTNDGALADLLALLYAEVKRRGGHLEAAHRRRAAAADRRPEGVRLSLGRRGRRQRGRPARGGQEPCALRGPVHRHDVRQDRPAKTSPTCTRFPTCSSPCFRPAGRSPASGG